MHRRFTRLPLDPLLRGAVRIRMRDAERRRRDLRRTRELLHFGCVVGSKWSKDKPYAIDARYRGHTVLSSN